MAQQTTLPTTHFGDTGLELALDAGRRLGVPLPTTTATNDLLTLARSLGYERRDVASVHEALAELADSR
jgi:3-hydroxyisobutyrate dehydrogenase-like beta-hydroxyacid dehydrogenase